jgi:hypothetical protein
MKMPKICMPALVYLILSVISLLMMIFNDFKLVATLIKIIFIVVWTWILNLICSAGYEWLSWVLVLLPFVIMLILVLLFYNAVINYLVKQEMKNL